VNTPVFTNVSPSLVRRPIGRTQRFFLLCCREHGYYSRGGGWSWGGPAQSLRLAQGLLDRGLLGIEITPGGRCLYKITKAGLAVLATPAPYKHKGTTP